MNETVISEGGTPIFLVPRKSGGLLMAQRSSRVLLSATELQRLLDRL